MAFRLRGLTPHFDCRKMAGIAFLALYFAAAATAQSLTQINPPSRTDLTSIQVTITLTGTGFMRATGLGFAPDGVISSQSPWNPTSDTSSTVTLTMAGVTTSETISLWVIGEDGTTSAVLQFGTGIASSVCLETIQSGGCALLWEVDATSATGSSSQSTNNTTPNILVTLDYLWRPAKSRPQKHLLANRFLETAPLSSLHNVQILRQADGSQRLVDVTSEDGLISNSLLATARSALKRAKLIDSPLDHLSAHVGLKTGYTQVVTATTVQPASGNTCPGGTSTSTASCTAAIPQQAFVAEASGKFGWNTGVNGQGTFAEFGIGGRGSFDYLIPNDKVVQSGGLTYIDLSSANPQNAVGLYEATAHFLLSQINHEKTLTNSSLQNTSNLLAFAAGYQNNRGLQQLAASTQTNTRNRYVARFTVSPEISGKNHTKLTVGMEYSGGINGGPHVVQLFFGTNVNPAKLFQGN